MQRKQDKTLYVALHVLLNLAEDVGVEYKMVRKNLVEPVSTIFSHSTSAPLLVTHQAKASLVKGLLV